MNKIIISALILISMLIIIGQSCKKDVIESKYEYQPSKTDVSLEIAKKVALNYAHDFFREESKSMDPSEYRAVDFKPKRRIHDVSIIKSTKGAPLLYAINLEEGFVVVSATKKISPILAFSKTGKFDLDEICKLPIGLNLWIDEQKEGIASIRNNSSFVIVFLEF